MEEETLGYIIAGFLFLLLIIGIITTAVFSVRTTFLYFWGDHYNRYWLSKPLESKYKSFIEENLTYYKSLNSDQKKLFELRLQKFIDKKNFVAKGDLDEIRPEMEALIGSAAIQITFGLPGIYLKSFHTIFVYPNDYYSNITRNYHQGEVNTDGIIVLSWVNFLKGYLDDSDGRNLGLHEMAHALKIEDYMINEEFNFFNLSDVNEFTKLTRIEAQIILDGGPSFFRNYASTNDHEFFAVIIENFFERSKEFKNHHPHLYKLTAKLLNQDPLTLGCNTTF